MNVLDENIIFEQREILRRSRIRFRQIAAFAVAHRAPRPIRHFFT